MKLFQYGMIVGFSTVSGWAQEKNSAGSLPETLVIADRSAQVKSETNTAISVIDSVRLRLYQPQSLADVFRFEPNVSFSGGPRVTGQQLEIRGQGGNDVTVRIDGARQNFVSGHTGQRFFVDPLFLRSAEIIRGAQSHLYGSGAAGVVNLSIFQPDDFLDEESSYGGRIHSGYQTVNDEQSYAGLFALGDEKLSFLLGFVNRSSGDLRLGNGRDLAGSAIDRNSYMTKLNYAPNAEHKFSYGFNYYDSIDQNGANPQGGVNTGNPLVDRNTTSQQFTTGHTWNPADNDLLNLRTTAYYNLTNQARDYLSSSGANFKRSNEHVLETFGIDMSNRAKYDAFGAKNTLVSGFEFFQDQQEGTESRATFYAGGIPGTSSGRPNADAKSLGIFLENQAAFENDVTFTSGLRYDHYATDGRNSNQSGSQLSPHLAIRYELNKAVALYADYAVAFTVPTLNQIYQDGSHFGVVPRFSPGVSYSEEVFVPNPSLAAQNSQNFEIGIDVNREAAGGTFSGKVNAFQQLGQDTFDSEIVGSRVTPGYSGFAGPGTLTQNLRQSVNREETTIQGVEIDVTYKRDHWYSRMAYSHLRGKDDQTGNKLNTITGDQLYLETGYKPLENLTLGVNALFVGNRRDKVADPSLKTAGYDTYGLFATWTYAESVNFTVGVNNLLDQEFQLTNVNNTEAGRNFFVSAAYTF
jgi:hemoglobin/transferrin/lactoferrin receptor protein